MYFSNQHEHIYGYIPADIFVEEYGKIFGHGFGSQTLNETTIKNGKNRSLEAISAIFGSSAVEVFSQKEKLSASDPELERQLSYLTLETISQTLGAFHKVPPEKILQQFIGFGAQSQSNISAHKFNEDIRKQIFKKWLRKDRHKYDQFVNAIFESTLRRVPLRYRKKVAFSVPGELFEYTGLVKLKETFQNHGSQAEFYYSYPRYKLCEDAEIFQSKLQLIERAVKEGWAHGVDITGSIEEGREKVPSGGEIEQKKKEHFYYERLVALVRGISKQAVLKVHAFEASRNGPFYKAMWNLFENMALGKIKAPATIGIAHIAELTSQDMDRFIRLREKGGLHFVFDANLLSNIVLQGKAAKDLVRTLQKLTKRGFDVGFGGDGQGIVGEYRLGDLKALFAKYLPADQAQKVSEHLMKNQAA